MTNEHDESVIAEATRRLVEQFQPTRVVLFGSRARGDADARSDVDLLVVMPFEGSRRDLALAMDRALRGLGLARDLVVLTPEEVERDRGIPGTIARTASIEGKILYEAA